MHNEKKDEEKSFQGWDFSYLDNRWKEEKLPWDYKALLKKYLKSHYQLLDVGTGGGEFLLSLNHPYEKTAVTEAWEPNVKLCKEKLLPLGICVRQAHEDNELPFEDNSFDMIINRHSVELI
ncbi:MAG: class I SAM-dependent methyltransferase [Anaeromicrobium sp.]|nr:methyltransferase domain-containing protein [Anaeromicrobium sp.]MCT4594983.1 class I SAM-dependent methyltransferase [Anaeromicrobium sp.]